MSDANDSNDVIPSSDPFAMATHIKTQGPAPVHLWDPPYCGSIDMKILSDGSWLHEGRPIRRQALIRLFSSILKREGEEYFLVTPLEKVGIEVEDCPFVVIDMEVEGSGTNQSISFTTNMGDQVSLDSEHPLSVDTVGENAEPRPRLLVRDALPALIKRSVFYRLVDLAVEKEQNGQRSLGVWSRQSYFPLGSV